MSERGLPHICRCELRQYFPGFRFKRNELLAYRLACRDGGDRLPDTQSIKQRVFGNAVFQGDMHDPVAIQERNTPDAGRVEDPLQRIDHGLLLQVRCHGCEHPCCGVDPYPIVPGASVVDQEGVTRAASLAGVLCGDIAHGKQEKARR